MKNLNLKNSIFFSAMVLMLLTSSCASTGGWKSEDLSSTNFKGLTGEQVVQKFGKPDRKFTDSSGKQIWEYRKPAESQEGVNKFMAIGSFGMASGSNSMYVDILKIQMVNNKVANYSYEENSMGISIPGMMNSQPVPAAFKEDAPIEKKVAKEIKMNKPVPAIAAESVNTTNQSQTTTTPASTTVTKNKAKMRSKPSTKSAVMKSLKKGDVVQILKEKNGWCLIELTGGETGWCQKDILTTWN